MLLAKIIIIIIVINSIYHVRNVVAVGKFHHCYPVQSFVILCNTHPMWVHGVVSKCVII